MNANIIITSIADMFRTILSKTLKVCGVPQDRHNHYQDGSQITRQLDAALMKSGFKLSGELFAALSKLTREEAQEFSVNILSTVKELTGDHVEHNAYFIDFPKNVPDTHEFWVACIVDALFDPASARTVELQLASGVINLLDLPKYGRYQHSFEDMVAVHDQFMPSAKDRVTVLHLGKSLAEEAGELYQSLAGSTIPLNDADKGVLKFLADACVSAAQPEMIPVRENRSIINTVRIGKKQSLLVDTTTDVLRVLCVLSGGDEALAEKTKFTSFPRSVRRVIMQALEQLIKKHPAKLLDVLRYTEEWKRLASRLHPFADFKELTHAHKVFKVASGELELQTLEARVEQAFRSHDVEKVLGALQATPGIFFRKLDRIFRQFTTISDATKVFDAISDVIPSVSTRVVLSVCEHFQNRTSQDSARVFINAKGRPWVTQDERQSLNGDILGSLFTIFETALHDRFAGFDRLVVDRDVLGVALPLSQKQQGEGLNVVPRGSVTPLDGNLVRFFTYWRQSSHRTDFDLSMLMLGEDFEPVGQVSYTNLKEEGIVHSGDITEAPDGATEFIDIDLHTVEAKYILPVVYVYSGERFNEVAESFFGYMERTAEQFGLPYEASTVRVKSDVRENAKVAMPMVFVKDAEDGWSTKWLHCFGSGQPNFNRIEQDTGWAPKLVRAAVEREYITMEYLVRILEKKATSFLWADEVDMATISKEPVTYIGMERPEGLHPDSVVHTLYNLHDLIPE